MQLLGRVEHMADIQFSAVIQSLCGKIREDWQSQASGWRCADTTECPNRAA